MARQIQPAIVVIAFNRNQSLARLLNSISKATYEDESVPLIISIDNNDNDKVYDLAQSFEWPYGAKKVIEHSEHLGLKEHVLRCGDLTQEYGSAIILEDDLLVSPDFYNYSRQAITFYQEDSNIGGISLYNYQTTENRFYRFDPLDDGSDVYFIQVASSWGQAWTSDQWIRFREWYKDNCIWEADDCCPQYLHEWQDSSWKRQFIKYLVLHKKYFVFPRISLSTNFEEPGSGVTSWDLFQVPLKITKHNYRFSKLEESIAVYDPWFEILPEKLKRLNPSLGKYDYDVDLYGEKKINSLKKEYILTSQFVEDPIFSFGLKMRPPESNIIHDIKGNIFSFTKRKNHIGTTNYKKKFLPTPCPTVCFIFFIREESIHDILFTVQALKKVEYSNYCIVIYAPPTRLPEVTNLLEQNKLQGTIFYYPTSASEKLGSVFDKIMQKKHNDYYLILKPGEMIFSNALVCIQILVRNFPDINWFCGLSAIFDIEGRLKRYTSLPESRWSSTRFKNEAGISSYSTFWSGNLWKKVKQICSIESEKDLWNAFFSLDKLYTIDQPIGGTRNHSKVSKPYWVSPIKYVYLKDIPYFRVIYREQHKLPILFKYDLENNSFYFSDY